MAKIGSRNTPHLVIVTPIAGYFQMANTDLLGTQGNCEPREVPITRTITFPFAISAIAAPACNPLAHQEHC
jgi:hypothetical protein